MRREPEGVRCRILREDRRAPAPDPAPTLGARRGGGGGDSARRRRDEGWGLGERGGDGDVGGGESAQRAHGRHARVPGTERDARVGFRHVTRHVFGVRREGVFFFGEGSIRDRRRGGDVAARLFFFFRIRRERAEGAAENRSAFEIRRRGVGAGRRERGGGPRELSQETARAREDETTTVFFVPVAPVATAATAVGALHPGG